jgi:hypothetical protein
MSLPRMAARACVRPTCCRFNLTSSVMALCILLCIFSSVIWAQDLQSSDDQNTIRGTVVNAITHLPIARALVHSGDDRYAVMSDSDGHFEFTGQPGEVGWLLARKPGFLGDLHTWRAITASSGSEITITLMPESIIKGRVSTSTGETIPGIQVQLLAQRIQDGFARWTPAAMVQTKSDGSFRFAELTSGSYRVMTHEFMDNDPLVNATGSPGYGFPPVYFPAASDFSGGATINLTAGQTFEANLTITEQQYFPVRIPVADGEMNGGMDIRVKLHGQSGPGYSLGYNADMHRIEGLLPNGNYTVDARTFAQDSTSGEVNLRVAGAPVEGPALTLTRNSSVTLEVKEEFTQTSRTSAANGGDSNRPNFVRGPQAYLYPTIEPADDFAPWGGGIVRPPDNSDEDSIVIQNILPGRYWLRLNTGRGYVASATVGGIDLLHQPFDVGAASNVPIEVTLRDDTASLEGTVAGTTSQSAMAAASGTQQAWVYCVPIGESSGRFQGPFVTEGKFHLSAIPPGTYRVMAFASQRPDIPYRDPEAMRAYDTMGQVIQLAASQSVSVQLQIIPDE